MRKMKRMKRGIKNEKVKKECEVVVNKLDENMLREKESERKRWRVKL